MTRSRFVVASRVVVSGLVALFLSTPVRAQTDGSNLQPRRAMGWLTRERWCTALGIERPMGEGSSSSAAGRAATICPSATSKS